jgi:hypothetical protein
MNTRFGVDETDGLDPTGNKKTDAANRPVGQ